MPINPDRLRECTEILGMALNPVDDNETFNFEGQEIKLHQFIPLVMKHLNKIILKHPDRAEEILDYLTDAILYTRELTDEAPSVAFFTNEEMRLRQSGHADPKFKIKTQ